MRLHDGVTPVLRSIQQAMHTTLNAFEQMQRATNQPINNRDLQMARDNINDVGAAIRRAEQEQERLNPVSYTHLPAAGTGEYHFADGSGLPQPKQHGH